MSAVADTRASADARLGRGQHIGDKTSHVVRRPHIVDEGAEEVHCVLRVRGGLEGVVQAALREDSVESVGAQQVAIADACLSPMQIGFCRVAGTQGHPTLRPVPGGRSKFGPEGQAQPARRSAVWASCPCWM